MYLMPKIPLAKHLRVEIMIRTCFRDLYSNSIPSVAVILSKDTVVPFMTKLDNFRSFHCAKQVRISGTWAAVGLGDEVEYDLSNS